MLLEEKLKVPVWIHAPWLTKEHIKKNSFYPVPDEWLENPSIHPKFKDTCFGAIRWGSRQEYRPGDIIIFDEYDECVDENGKYETDRFQKIDKEDIEGLKNGERDLLPVGVVTHPPKRIYTSILYLNLFK